MGKWFTYHLILVSVGSPSGLAVYHYFIKSDQSQQAQDCCCKEKQESCSAPCTDTCSKSK